MLKIFRIHPAVKDEGPSHWNAVLRGRQEVHLDDGRFVSEDTKLCTESLHVARALSRASAPV